MTQRSNYRRRRSRDGKHRTATFILLGVAVTILGATEAYTNRKVQQLAQAASLSYLPMDVMPTSPYFEPSQLRILGQVVDPYTESGATVFSHKNQVIVACRGSANPKNFGTNLKFNLVPATRLSQIRLPNDALVHEGFQEASVGLWQKLGPPLLETLRRQPFETKLTEVIFTGHSLGAATALLCAVHYSSTQTSREMIDAYIQPDIITFGGPKVCNGKLARHLRRSALQGSNILHFVHSQDPVLANNQRLWDQYGFEDVGIELECDPQSPWVYLNEDEISNKSMFGVAWNILDHCKYMGIFVGPRMKSGGSSSGRDSRVRPNDFGIQSEQDRYRY